MCWLLSQVQHFATPWTAASQAPLPGGVSRPEHWSGLPCPPPGDLPNLGIEPRPPSLQADSLPSEPTGKPKVCLLYLFPIVHGIRGESEKAG